jgi:hypothetical protein
MAIIKIKYIKLPSKTFALVLGNIYSEHFISASCLQFLNNVIIIKTKVLLLRSYVTLDDFGDPP